MDTKTLPKHQIGPEAEAIGAKWADTFAEYGGVTTSSRILDIGCGAGRMALAIGRRFGFANSYLGFDIIKRDIDWCNDAIAREHKRFRFVHIDIRNGHYNPNGKLDPVRIKFPADDHAFDFIFATSVFTHMRTEEMLAYLSEAKRCLADGGVFIATFFLLDDFRGEKPPTRNFATALDDQCFTATPENPEDAIAYRREFVMQQFRERFAFVQFVRGLWSGGPGKHSQDFLVGHHFGNSTPLP